MRACIALSRKMRTNFSGNWFNFCLLEAVSASSVAQSCHARHRKTKIKKIRRVKATETGSPVRQLMQELRVRGDPMLCMCSKFHARPYLPFNQVGSVLHVIYFIPVFCRHEPVRPNQGHLLGCIPSDIAPPTWVAHVVCRLLSLHRESFYIHFRRSDRAIPATSRLCTPSEGRGPRSVVQDMGSCKSANVHAVPARQREGASTCRRDATYRRIGDVGLQLHVFHSINDDTGTLH
jgi:hypothetical protein